MLSLTATDTRKAVALRSIEIMATGDADDFAAAVHPAFFNHEQRDEPPEARGSGPERALAVARWLRAAYDGLDWEVHEAIAEDDLVAVHCTMSGRHTGDFAAYDLDGQVAEAFAPTGRTFATTQSHWLRIADGQAIEHWANRDDLGTARQLGWVPPTPRSLVRNALAKRRAVRAAAAPRRAEERPFTPYAGDTDGTKNRALDALVEALRDGFDADAFAALAPAVHTVIAEGELVAIHLTLRGRQVGPFTERSPDGRVVAVFPPTGATMAVTQTHWFRFGADGEVAAHWAERDDLGMAMQLGWVPPSPLYLARMALARRRARV